MSVARSTRAAVDPTRIQTGPSTCAVAMTAVAGFVDLVSSLLLAQVYVANMSGNSIAAGAHAAAGDWRLAVHRGYPILTFVIGLIVGGCVAEVGRRRWGTGPAVRVNLLLELGLLGAFTLCGVVVLGGHPHVPGQPSAGWEAVLVALAAVGMGVQNVTLRATGALSVYTTHVTGSLTQLADEAVRYGLWCVEWSIWRGRHRRPSPAGRWMRLLRASPFHPQFRWMLLHLGLWFAYVAGAVGGALSLGRWGVAAMCLPMLVLVLVVLAGCGRKSGAAR